DSALTSLTTSFCVDFLGIGKKPEHTRKRIRKVTHVGMSALLILVVIAFKHILDTNVIDGLLKVASYTYGPLLGLFAFGIFTKYKVKDNYVWIVALVSVVISFVLGKLPPENLWGYVFGYELLPLNGMITFIGLLFIRKKS
ncbi:MAG: sodium:solute symporter, partial [Maribacter sp.]|nr:sodium:solute symporter [Maribacter sp.]